MTSYRKPNLFIIGAMKAGSTSICRQLARHPQIYMTPVKETFYFSKNYSHVPLSVYLSQFDGAGKETYVAEGTTDYSSFPTIEGVPARIHTFNPDSRFIYLIRKPLDRAVSHYQHFVLEGRESRPLLQALDEEPSYLWRSYYAVQLRNYLQYFDREQIFIGFFEQYQEQPLTVLNDIFSWLGLENWDSLDTENIRANETIRQKTVLDSQAWNIKIVRYLKRFQIIQNLTPRFVVQLYRLFCASKKEINFDSPEFKVDVELAKQRYAPMMVKWEQELLSILEHH